MSRGYETQFEKLPWVSLSEYAREKRAVADGYTVRLLQLDEGFEETDWCRTSHAGYVIAGILRINLSDRTEQLEAGDALVLPGGENGKHKAVVDVGPVVLFLVESA